MKTEVKKWWSDVYGNGRCSNEIANCSNCVVGSWGLLADLHCDSLELLLLKVSSHGNIIKTGFAGSRDHTVPFH